MHYCLRRDDLALREIDGEVVLLCLRSSTYFTLNRTGSVVLRTLQDGPADASALVRRLVDEFDVEPSEVAGDVDDFLLELAASGLVVSDG